MRMSSVVAVSDNNAIGKDKGLLWHLPKDMEYFKAVTYGHHVLMGRKSFESIPEKYRPLRGRVNIIVTRQKDFIAEGCKVVSTAEEGVQYAKDNGEDELMVLGGGEIYKYLLAKTDRIYLTKVRHTFLDADTFFPELIADEWNVKSNEKHSADEKHLYDFEFLVIDRVK
ncbi:MAG: dihydrofolate reductase [Bacteroidota bacterium]